MMMGDFQTNKMGVSDSIINYFLYVTFICVMSVIILNLFVGIAVGEIKQTLDEADIQQISMRIVYLLKVLDLNFLLILKIFKLFFILDSRCAQIHQKKYLLKQNIQYELYKL